jgi:hypothetical protein
VLRRNNLQSGGKDKYTHTKYKQKRRKIKNKNIPLIPKRGTIKIKNN